MPLKDQLRLETMAEMQTMKDSQHNFVN